MLILHGGDNLPLTKAKTSLLGQNGCKQVLILKRDMLDCCLKMQKAILTIG